jgi:hypothetical protein
MIKELKKRPGPCKGCKRHLKKKKSKREENDFKEF